MSDGFCSNTVHLQRIDEVKNEKKSNKVISRLESSSVQELCVRDVRFNKQTKEFSSMSRIWS